MDVQIVGNTVDDVKLMRFKGRLDAHNADYIEEKITEAIKESGYRLIADLQGVEYIGSCGFRIFLSVLRQVKEKNGRFAILKMTPQSLKILKVMEIDYLFNLFDDQKEAIAFCKAG